MRHPAPRIIHLALTGLAIVSLSGERALAQLAISANDAKVVNVDGKNVVQQGAIDTATILDLSTSPPKVIGEVKAPASVVGPPQSVAIAPDESIALVTASTKIDPADPKKTASDNKLTVIDLKANPPAVISTIKGGKQPSGMAINRAGNLALVANRADNSVTVLSISGKEVKVVDSVAMGEQVSAVAFTPDGKRALAVKNVNNKTALLSVDGDKVSYSKYDMLVGLFPYNVGVTPNGKLALTANNGASGFGDGNIDTVGVIDMEANPPRVIDEVVVGDAPEGLAISPTGKMAVAVLVRGSTASKSAFFYTRNGSVAVLAIDGKKVKKVGEVEVRGVPEGAVFSPDGKYLYVGNYMDDDISILKVSGTKVRNTGKRVELPGHPASMRGVVP